MGEEEKERKEFKNARGDAEREVSVGFVSVVFCVFLVVEVEDGFYDVVGPRKFGDFGSRGGSRLRGE